MMNQINLLSTAILLCFIFSCSNQKKIVVTERQDNSLETIVELMTGKFSSNVQSLRDTLFYDISLTMIPIWRGNDAVKWLYVEQAASNNIRKPYRQRIYRLSQMHDNSIESRVYTLPTPSKFIHAWERPDLFSQITPASLTLKEGCAVYLQLDENDCFSGATSEQDCKSTMRGASYATSSVSVCADQIVSWDQGWDARGNQVWGAETEGYIFDRLSQSK